MTLPSAGYGTPNGLYSKVAVTSWASFIETWQLSVPLHPEPLQPRNVESGSAAAVSVT